MSTCGEPCDGCPNRAEHHLCDACCHDEVDALQRKTRELREKLEWQSACTKALMESQERFAAELNEARAVLSALCSEFESAVAHADWRAAGSPGMSVPFTGDFASATQLPSIVGRMRWWAREMRKVLGEEAGHERDA